MPIQTPLSLLSAALLAGVLLASVPATAQPDTLRLSLDQAVALALEHHLGLRRAQLGVQIQEQTLTQERLRFGRTFTTSLSHQANRSLSTSRLEEVAITQSNAQNLGVGLSQDLATGGSLSLDFNNQRSYSNAAYVSINPTYRSDLQLRFSQPLLQGRGRVNRLGQELARQGLARAQVGVEGQRQDLAAQVGLAYWDLVLAQENLQFNQQLLAGAQRLLEYVQVRAEIGTQARSTILQAQVGLAQRQEQIVTAQGARRQAEDQLKSLLGLDQEPARWSAALHLTEGPAVTPFAGDPERGLALARHPAYRQAQLQQQSLQLQLELARDQTRPALSLTARAGLSGIDSTYQDNLTGIQDNRAWQGGVNLVFPLGQTPAQARLQQRQLEYQQSQLDLEQLRLQLAEQVRNQHRQVGLSRQREEAAGWTERLAEQSVREEEERLKLGLSTVRQVLDAQDDLAQAHLNRLQALLDYTKALIEWHRLTGE